MNLLFPRLRLRLSLLQETIGYVFRQRQRHIRVCFVLDHYSTSYVRQSLYDAHTITLYFLNSLLKLFTAPGVHRLKTFNVPNRLISFFFD